MAKNYNTKRLIAKDVVYGSLLELSKNKSVWYESSIDSKYSHLTDEGKDAIIPFIENIFREMQAIEREVIKETAKQQTMDSLTGKE